MYPKLGAIPTPTGEEGESGEVDAHVQSEYADEGQQQNQICKKWKPSCSVKAIAVSMIFTIAFIVGGVFLYHHLTCAALAQSPYPVTDSLVPSLDTIDEWKALEFVFKRSQRTKTLFSILDRYENLTDALEGGNDGHINRVKVGDEIEFALGCQGTQFKTHVSIRIDAKKKIVVLRVYGLADDDILDVSYLPQHLKSLDLRVGTLTGIDLSKLPRRLEVIILAENKITKMAVAAAPTALKILRLVKNPLEKNGITFTLPLPDMRLQVSNIDSVNADNGRLSDRPDDYQNTQTVDWADGTQIKIEVV